MHQEDYEIRIGTCGQVDTGKSTLLGILTNPKNAEEVKELDDGRGLARKRIFKHQHEKDTGVTAKNTNQPSLWLKMCGSEALLTCS